MGLHLIEDIKVLCKNGKVMIPTSLWHRAVSWYHHYLQHPGHSRLKETMRSVMYWKGMRTTIRKYIKSCRSCQVNKRHSQKYGHLHTTKAGHLSWECRRHVGEMSAICGNVDEFGNFCVSVPTPKFPRHKIFVSKIADTVPHTRTYIRTKIQKYCR